MGEMSEDERELDAAERSLGTLPRAGEDADARARREGWDRRFAPLLDPVPPAEPPEGMFGRISAALGHSASATGDTAALRLSLARWRRATVLAGALAAGLALWIAVPLVFPEPAPRYVAVVTADADGTPGLIVEFDTASGIATVIPVGAAAPEGQVLEMWHLPEGADRPYSIGLMPADAELLTTISAGPGDLVGISIEPPGGSPTGQPTEALWHGTFVEVE